MNRDVGGSIPQLLRACVGLEPVLPSPLSMLSLRTMGLSCSKAVQCTSLESDTPGLNSALNLSPDLVAVRHLLPTQFAYLKGLLQRVKEIMPKKLVAWFLARTRCQINVNCNYYYL